jgi:hypothetical protein
MEFGTMVSVIAVESTQLNKIIHAKETRCDWLE